MTIDKRKVIEMVRKKEWYLQPEYKFIRPGRSLYNYFDDGTKQVVDFDQPWKCFDNKGNYIWSGILDIHDIIEIYGEDSPYIPKFSI